MEEKYYDKDSMTPILRTIKIMNVKRKEAETFWDYTSVPFYMMIGFIISVFISVPLIFLLYLGIPLTSESPAEKQVMVTQKEVVYRDSDDLSDVVESVMPSMAIVNGTSTVSQFSFFGGVDTVQVPSSGSGFLIGETEDSLYVATNFHVVDGVDDIMVEFFDGSSAPAVMNGSSPSKDIAVLQVKTEDISEETRTAVKPAKLIESDDLRVGNQVIAIGNAIGYGQTVTVGYIGALNREVPTESGTSFKVIQTDAAINPGNSGGALINRNGEVIGINAAKIASTDVEGIGYAIPISDVTGLIKELSKKPVPEEQQGYLGVEYLEIDEQMQNDFQMPAGIFVRKILNPELEKAGLKEHDIIFKADDQSIESGAEISEILKLKKQGDIMELSVWRMEEGEYKEMTVSAVLIKKPDKPQPEQ